MIARHGQAVDLHRCSMEFHGGLTRTFRLNVSVGDVDSAAGTARHGVAVVHLKGRQGWVVVRKVNALQPKVNRIDGQDALTCRAADAAVPASYIAGGRFNVVGFKVVQTRLFLKCRRWRGTVVFGGQVPEINAPCVEHVGCRIAVVCQVHALNRHRRTVNDDALLGVVVQHPIAALHGTARGGVDAGADRP